VEAVLTLAAVMAAVVLFSASWIRLVRAGGPDDVVWGLGGLVGGCALAGLAVAVEYRNPFSLGLGAVLREGADEPPGRPGAAGFARTALEFGGMFGFMSAVLAGLVTLVVALAGWGAPSVEGTVRVELVGFAAVFVIWFFRFRRSSYAHPRVPAAMAGLTGVSLALTAALLAASGARIAPVTVGPVPALLVAVLPGLAVALVVFLVDVHPHRHRTRGYRLCLLVALLAGLVGLVVRPTLGALVGAVLPGA
jgi:hypothetical protein